jgi:hypothetical protein
MNKHNEAIANSNRTNRLKADSNPNNMRAIALLRSLSMEGKTLSEMADLLNAQGFVTSRGYKFQKVQVSRLLAKL